MAIVRPAAETDIVLAQTWYEQERRGLGREFRLQIDAAIQRVRAFPYSYRTIHDPIRRVILHRFPFSLYYVVDAETITVLACIDARRSPEAIFRQLRERTAYN